MTTNLDPTQNGQSGQTEQPRSDNEMQVTTVETYGPYLVAQAANNVEARVEDGTSEPDAILIEIQRIARILDTESFIEWAAFAKEVCDLFDVAECYEYEQRETGLFHVEDWRVAVRHGFWGVVRAAIKGQLANPKAIDIPDQTNQQVDADTVVPTIDPETWDGMTDTVVREGISTGHFCWNIVTTVLPEILNRVEDPITYKDSL